MKYKCFYCGNECNMNNNKNDYVKKTFTNYDIIKMPSSQYICNECVWAFGSKSEIKMINGEKRIGSPRNYSWLITENKKTAFTKAHIKQIRKIIINPEPFFKLVLSDSGQKHLIFRSEWAYEKDNYPIQFEEEKIIINIAKFKRSLYLADELSAIFGKMALLKCDKISYAIAVQKKMKNLETYNEWLGIKNQKISKLAAWLAKSKKEIDNESIKSK